MTGPVVLAPLGGSKTVLCALPVAKGLSTLQDVPLRILHVDERDQPLAETARQLGLEPEHMRGATLDVRAGDPAQAILKMAADCQAKQIVMCCYGDEVRPAAAISAVVLAVLCEAPCPVVLVSPTAAPQAWTLKRVLAPHDGSPSVSGGLAPAAELARKAGAELVVLQVADDDNATESGSMAPLLYVDQPQHTWPVWADEFLQRLRTVCALTDVRLRLRVSGGEPAAETIRVAKEESADLLVLAWKGHWEDSRAPTLKAVLQGAPCPVMVTRVAAT